MRMLAVQRQRLLRLAGPPHLAARGGSPARRRPARSRTMGPMSPAGAEAAGAAPLDLPRLRAARAAWRDVDRYAGRRGDRLDQRGRAGARRGRGAGGTRHRGRVADGGPWPAGAELAEQAGRGADVLGAAAAGVGAAARPGDGCRCWPEWRLPARCGEVAAVDARLKWPNDVLLGGGKLAGILAEQSGDAIAVGIGINVLGRGHDLPTAAATSLERGGARPDGPDRAARRRSCGSSSTGTCLARDRTAMRPGAGCGRSTCRLCATLGRVVRVQLPGDRVLTGTAVDVDSAGQLLIRRDGGDVVAVSAGDVIHVR